MKVTQFFLEQKTEFEEFNCFFVDLLRYRFGRIKVISTLVEREYTPAITRHNATDLLYTYQLTGHYMVRGFTEWYFLTASSYILENHFYFVNAPDYCFNPSLSRIFCVNSLVKVLSPRYEGPSTDLFRTSSLCTFII